MAEEQEVCEFVENLWQVIEEGDCHSPVRWGPRDRGIILNPGGFWRLSLEINSAKKNRWPFAKLTLNWLSRQLCLHGFYKCKYSSNLYFHPAFRRGRPDILHFITPKEQPQVYINLQKYAYKSYYIHTDTFQSNFSMKIDEKSPGLMVTIARELLKSTLESTQRTLNPNRNTNMEGMYFSTVLTNAFFNNKIN